MHTPTECQTPCFVVGVPTGCKEQPARKSAELHYNRGFKTRTEREQVLYRKTDDSCGLDDEELMKWV